MSGGATPHGVPTFPRGSRRPGKSGCHGEDVNPDNTVGKFQKIVERQQTAIDKVVLGFEKLYMPKREFLCFDGDSSKDPRFIKNFELNLESTIEDDNVRLSYLIQYCTGKAKEAMENCVILPGAEGYIEDITCPRVDMNFIFEWSTRYLTSERSERVRYRVDHEKIKFISISGHVMFCLLYKHQ